MIISPPNPSAIRLLEHPYSSDEDNDEQYIYKKSVIHLLVEELSIDALDSNEIHWALTNIDLIDVNFGDIDKKKLKIGINILKEICNRRIEKKNRELNNLNYLQSNLNNLNIIQFFGRNLQ